MRHRAGPVSRDGTQLREYRQQRAEQVRGEFQAEAVHRLVNRGPGLFQRAHQDQGVRLRKSPAVLDMLLSKTAWEWLCRGQ